METFTAHCNRSIAPSLIPQSSWRDDLIHQIQVIGDKDPSKARDLHRRILFCNWSRFELYKLSQEGLDVSRVKPNPGLPGGMLEGAELAFKVTAGVIEIIMEGNKKQVLAEKETQLIPAKAFLSGRGDVHGHHEGGRILSKGRRSFGSFAMKRFHLIATGKGSFISQDVRYEGEFYNNVFHDLTGNAKLYIGDTRYTGCFRDGKKCGPGRLEKYDKEKNQYFLYYEGLFEGDQPKTGTVYTSTGEELARYNEGSLEKLIQSTPSQSSLGSQNSQSQDTTQQLFGSVYPAVPVSPQSGGSGPVTPPPIPVAQSVSEQSPVTRVSHSPSNLSNSRAGSTASLRESVSPASTRLGDYSGTPPSSRKQPETSERPSGKRISSTRFNPNLPPEEACPLIARKLSNPRGELSLNESIELLTTCIRYGQERAEKIADKEGVIVIGNTGAGKSTMVNFLSGCTMEFRDPEDLGLKGVDDVVVVVPTQEGGALDEVMPIGHTKESKTFMPQIETDPKEKVTYCDCPGFLDNRGAEINIANAVNVKNAIARASGVKVIVLINYYSLKADRGRGLTDMLTICSNLFGRAENIEKHKESLFLAVSNIPQNMRLKRLKNWLVEDTPEIMQVLSERLFLFDPLDRPIDGGWNRSECIEHIKALPPIENPSSIFKTVLTDADEKKLMAIGEGMKAEIERALVENNLSHASSRLNHLDSLSVIDHVAIERILDQSFYQVTVHFRKVIDDFRTHCHFENFNAATTLLENLKQGLTAFGERLNSVIELEKLHGYYSESEKRYEQRLAKERAQQEQLERAQGQIEKLLQLLEEQKGETQKELARQQASFEKLVSQMQSRIQETENSYTQLEATLKQELDQRLQQKDEELRIAKELGQQELNDTLEKEKRELEKAYQAKLQQSQAEKQKLLETQQKELSAREQQNRSRQKALEEKLAAIDSQKTSQVKELKDISRPQIAFGKAEWEKYFGDVGVEPPLPENINEILKSQCVYWPDKRVEDTHLLVLIPKTVDGKALTLDSLGELIERPRGGGHATKYRQYWDNIKDQYGTVGIDSSYWALVSKDVIPDSREKSYEDQCKLVDSSYRVSRSLELAASILMHHVRTGERLYPDSPWTCGRCEEKVKDDGWAYQVAIAGFGSGGLDVLCDFVAVSFGLSVSRKFSSWCAPN